MDSKVVAHFMTLLMEKDLTILKTIKPHSLEMLQVFIIKGFSNVLETLGEKYIKFLQEIKVFDDLLHYLNDCASKSEHIKGEFTSIFW